MQAGSGLRIQGCHGCHFPASSPLCTFRERRGGRKTMQNSETSSDDRDQREAC
jgi:hypothetical protein